MLDCRIYYGAAPVAFQKWREKWEPKIREAFEAQRKLEQMRCYIITHKEIQPFICLEAREDLLKILEDSP